MKHSLHVLSLTVTLLFLCSVKTLAQDSSALSKTIYFPDKLLNKINVQSASIDQRLTKRTEKYLLRLLKEELILKRKLSVIDSFAAWKIFGDAEPQYFHLQQMIKNTTGKIPGFSGNYLPHLDSLQTALKFFNRSGNSTDKNITRNLLLEEALNNVNKLQDRFTQADNITQLIKQRKKYLQDQLASYGLTKDLVKLQKHIYYYQAQVEEYKKVFNNSSVTEAKALAALQKTRLFRNFYREHSQLAGLFKLPDSSPENSIADFTSFQTRSGTDQQLLKRFGSIPDLQQISTAQTDASRSPFNQLKNVANKLSKGDVDSKMTNFKPNNQKTKSFLKRLELGTNLQTVKSSNFFPSTSDVALSLGYKINDKNTIGIGSSYKIGWGRDIRHLVISHQGMSLRSFLDVKFKGSFWLSGGVEMNYKTQFKDFEILNNYSPWQKSALLGISKKYRISKAMKGNMQLMYDFLSKQEIPRTQTVVFRIGYVW